MAPHSKSGPKRQKHSKEDKTLKRKREAEDHDRLKKAIDELVRVCVSVELSNAASNSQASTRHGSMCELLMSDPAD